MWAYDDAAADADVCAGDLNAAVVTAYVGGLLVVGFEASCVVPVPGTIRSIAVGVTVGYKS